jgi:5-formyltetrahydrofolate cyclo-ligase
LCERSKFTERARVLKARNGVREEQRTRANAALQAALVEAVRATVAAGTSRPVAGVPEPTIACYAPTATEPGGFELPSVLAAAAHPWPLLLPVLRSDGDLDWAAYEGRECLRPARYGLREPSGRRLGVEAIATAALVIVPAVAVDQTGTRLGRGGGSYDRALARVRSGVEIIAALFDGEFVARLPAEPHDLPVTTALVATDDTVRAVSTMWRG